MKRSKIIGDFFFFIISILANSLLWKESSVSLKDVAFAIISSLILTSGMFLLRKYTRINKIIG